MDSKQSPSIHNQPEYSVSEIAGALKRVVEDNFGQVRVRGEISGLKVAASGHVYLSLKDENAVLSGVCWRGTAARFRFPPEDGLEVICTGKITTYPGRSQYQLVIDAMEPAGAGALMALLEKRKKELAAEGLFDPARKKPLPFLPRVIGVVTSPTGAVIRDILHRIADRFPAHVLVWPVAVQGEHAAAQIADAIAGFNAMALPPDVIIVARGGGSLEDLWAFNEEIVVRAAAASRIPLISAVGHETDTTLIDHAADRRAPTPTAAAEMAMPVRSELLAAAAEYGGRLSAAVLRLLEQRSQQIGGLARGLPRPSQLLGAAAQTLDDWSERLRAAPSLLLRIKEQALKLALAGLRPGALDAEVKRAFEKTNELAMRMTNAATRLLNIQQTRLETLMQMLESLNYRKVLERGFVLVRDPAGSVVTSAAAVHTGQPLILTFRDGEKKAKAE